MAGLLSIGVESIDGKIKTDYYTYLKDYQKSAPWTPAILFIKRIVKFEFLKKNDPLSGAVNGDRINPYMLTRKQKAILTTAKKNIKCAYLFIICKDCLNGTMVFCINSSSSGFCFPDTKSFAI